MAMIKRTLVGRMSSKNGTIIPIEIMRTVVAITELGSLSKAGERLGLSQPAVSSQVKRLQNLIGGAVFQKSSSGATPTELGKLVLIQARKILDANDQVLQLGGKEGGPTALRLGLSTAFVERFMHDRPPDALSNIFVHADHSSAIRKGLLEGYIDIACVFAPDSDHEFRDTIVHQFSVPLVWIRANGFVIRPGDPIPLVTLPEDDYMIRPLVKAGLSYRIVFYSPDYQARMTAVRAGIGLGAVPLSIAPGDLVEAKEYYLPPLPALNAYVCSRAGLERNDATELLRSLSTTFANPPISVPLGLK
ncbi:DNA-binding transcriptional LysR family regulator [Bradyrhizobium sp. S3.3.6]